MTIKILAIIFFYNNLLYLYIIIKENYFVMAQLVNTPENHRLLNIGDIFKDANAKPERIKNKNILLENITNIVSKGTPIVQAKDEHDFNEVKKFIYNILLPQFKKFSYSSLPSILEDKDSTQPPRPGETIEFISKSNKNILPQDIIHFFIDAAMKPEKYKSLKHEKKDIHVIETFASHMDPAGREEPNLENILTNKLEKISTINLQEYGFNEKCNVIFDASQSTKQLMSLQIITKSQNLKCKLSRRGNIDIKSFNYNNKDIKLNEFNEVSKNLFKGNNYKNSFINKLTEKSSQKEKSIGEMFILLKELGDTMQAIILEKILKEKSLEKYLGTSCLLTNDIVLACRCSVLNVPHLLDGLTSGVLTLFLPALTKEDQKRVQKEYDKREKITEILKFINENNNVVDSLNAFKAFIEHYSVNRKITTEISISSAGTKLDKNVIISPIIEELENLIGKIGKANVILKDILKVLNENFAEVKITLSGLVETITDEYVELCKKEFSIFRIYIIQLKANDLIRKIDKDKKIAYCIGSEISSSLFIRKIPKKLGGSTSAEYLFIDQIDGNIIFNSGFITHILRLASIGGGGKRSRSKTSSKRSSKSSSKSSSKRSSKRSSKTSSNHKHKKQKTNKKEVIQNLYALIYPIIYCYPWLVEYILDYDTNKSLLIKLIEYILTNEEEEEKFNTSLTEIFSEINEEKYYKKIIEKNFDEKNNINDDSYQTTILNNITKILEKLYDSNTVKRNSVKRSSVKRNSVKPIVIKPATTRSVSVNSIHTPKKSKKFKSRLKGITKTSRRLNLDRNKENFSLSIRDKK